MQVVENDKNTPVLIGYLVLEALDFVINLKTQGLMGNPEHEGKWVVDPYDNIIVKRIRLLKYKMCFKYTTPELVADFIQT